MPLGAQMRPQMNPGGRGCRKRPQEAEDSVTGCRIEFILLAELSGGGEAKGCPGVASFAM